MTWPATSDRTPSVSGQALTRRRIAKERFALCSAPLAGFLSYSGSSWPSCPPGPRPRSSLAQPADGAVRHTCDRRLRSSVPGPNTPGDRGPAPLSGEGETTTPGRRNRCTRRRGPPGRDRLLATANDPPTCNRGRTSSGSAPMNARLYAVIVALVVGLVWVTVVAVRRYQFRRAGNLRKLGETLHRARIKQAPFVSSRRPRHGPGVGAAADPPDSTTPTDRPSDGRP